MCYVQLAIAGLAIAGQASQQNAQAEQAQAQINAQAQESRQALSLSVQRQFEEQLRINQEESERERQGLRERAKLRVAIGESGLVGNTTVRQLSASFIQQNLDEGTIKTNRELNLGKFQQERGNLLQSTDSRFRAIRSGVDTRGTGALKIASSAAGSFS